MQSQIKNQKSKVSPGFTLPELLISILLVVLLMLGVNQVFKMSSDTVGIGQTVARQTRDLRAAIGAMGEDAKRWDPQAPLFYIIGVRRNDGKRRDVIGFPARGSFRRHTANDGSFVSDTNALEAWIWYGHLEADVPNVLGRVQLVMKDEAAIKKTEDYIRPANADLAPLNPTSPATQSPWQLQHSRFDLIGTSIDGLKAIMEDHRPKAQETGPNDEWWRPAVELNKEVFRYQAKTVLPRPLTSASMAQVAPVFLTDCEEFRVEFAGDYYTQDNDRNSNTYGDYLSPRADGKLDYTLVTNRIDGKDIVREQVRWYGFPRDGNGDGKYFWKDDVIPVGTIRKLAPPGFTMKEGDDVNHPYFERDTIPSSPTDNIRYNVVFRDDAPKLIRVSFKLVDPTNRIQEGTWVEYVLGPQ